MTAPDPATIRRLIEALQAKIIATVKFKPGMGLPAIEREYQGRLESAMSDYIDSDRSVTAFRNAFRRAANDAFNLTASAGWSDGGQDGPMSDGLQSWVNDRIDREIAFIDDLFRQLRQMRQAGEPTADFITARAQGYTASLQGIYNYAKMAAMEDRPGKWIYGDTVQHCATCAGLHDEVHPLSYYLDNDLIPQQRGSLTLECGGWECDCSIVDPETGEQLIP